jgi:hypothetical protein
MLKAIKEYILQTFETMLFFLVLIVIAFFVLLGGMFFGPSGAALGAMVAMAVLAALFMADTELELHGVYRKLKAKL